MKSSVKGNVGKILTHLLLLAGAFIMIAPFLWMITTSLKSVGQTFQPPYLFPRQFVWQNYIDAWRAAPFPRYYLNSLIMTLGITISQVFFSSLAAYAFARLEFPGKNIIFLLFLATMMVPQHVTIIPSFLVVRNLGWVDTYAGLIVPRMVSAFGIFLMRQFYYSIPKELDEAALMDGASRLKIWWNILLPLSGPALVTLSIFSFLFAWNDFLWPLVMTYDPKMQTVQLGLAMFQGKYGTRWNLLMAGTVTATIPAILIFLFGQRRFIEGITTTGLKG